MRKHILNSLFPVVLLAAYIGIGTHPAQANCPGFSREPEQLNPEVQQRANQLKNDPNQFFGKKILDTITNRRITLTPDFDRLTGIEKQQVLNTLQLDGSTYEVYAADERLVSAQYDGCTRTYLKTERDRYGWYLNRPPVPMPLPMLRDALRNVGKPIWRKVNQSIHPEDERKARFKFWETVGYGKYNQSWWIAWVPEGGYFEVTVRNADCVTQLKPYLGTAFHQYRYVVIANDGTPLYDTQTELGNPWLSVLGKTSSPAGWNVSPCHYQNPFLCVYRNKLDVGSVELQRLMYTDYPILQTQFEQLGLAPGLFTYSNPSDKAKVLTALKAVIADYYQTITKERTSTYGTTYKVQVQQPEEVKIGDLPGLKYGFKSIDRSGQVREKYVSYMAFNGNLYIITTGYEPAAKSNTFKQLVSLEQFEPHLKAIMENLKLSETDR
ncbi:hypothetical protein [Nostoc sp. LEGE 12450]|uniref:hypothetical protein n=1 Tax=Nostoc sp. LEGE 12450 TaxID=1828643 RepID=UPI00187F6A2F|nr:hypothetical protein [Nostoc sp. LEGE 12450]MBE8992488.1 hypothetical protein [Nostoc sp. LEGE 12450]